MDPLFGASQLHQRASLGLGGPQFGAGAGGNFGGAGTGAGTGAAAPTSGGVLGANKLSGGNNGGASGENAEQASRLPATTDAGNAKESKDAASPAKRPAEEGGESPAKRAKPD